LFENENDELQEKTLSGSEIINGPIAFLQSSDREFLIFVEKYCAIFVNRVDKISILFVNSEEI
jgi:hypothetical protein